MKRVISLSGPRSSGKDTIAKHLINHYGFTKMAFADPVKDCLSIIFGWNRQMLEGTTAENRTIRETIDPYWSEKLGFNISPRIAMMSYGTDVMRNWINDIWVLSLENQMNAFPGDIVVTDTRFLNELEMLQKNGAIMTKIERLNLKENTETHISENEWPLFQYYSHTWHNNGSVRDLEILVDKFIDN